ncbi:MAG: D-alanine--D-alanine ligase, partial [Deltaproteobacteria bacterium]|nr:D-alanine--D-alanine ligase [Deltaproteobacteria bacterium]
MTDKPVVAVLLGGKSQEHEVSLESGSTVAAHLDGDRYRVLAVGIGKNGSLVDAEQTRRMLRTDAIHVTPCSGRIEPVAQGALLALTATDPSGKRFVPDVYFPVLHGPYGEDGTIQGLLELTGRPYVGCGVMASSVGMDKVATKELATRSGLPVLPFVALHRAQWDQDRRACLNRVQQIAPVPCFVKPSRMGSSVGISKVTSDRGLAPAIDDAFRHDYHVLVEPALDAREIECSVMGNHEIVASSPGEIEPSREFYDYEAKYVDGTSGLLVPAPLEASQTAEVQDMAKRAFSAIGAEGFGRVDFLLDKKTGA